MCSHYLIVYIILSKWLLGRERRGGRGRGKGRRGGGRKEEKEEVEEVLGWDGEDVTTGWYNKAQK